MKRSKTIRIGGVLLIPLLVVAFAERDAKTTYTAAYIDVPFAEGSLTVELLPEVVAIQRVPHMKTKGITFHRFPASSRIVPALRRSFSPALVPHREVEWPYLRSLVAIVSLILLITSIALVKERGVEETV